ncbi:MAG: 5-carboxymethyl-2-hydroxymuconate Delta-isomerase [Deltaproteobacteria bacterium]|nr:5-carboxymethyl-2-hydroxymuconate Delta-isomerase [Deltaproteobacteria bacterium]
MPHCIFEYTDNIKELPSWHSIFKKIHAVLLNTGEWQERDIKSRAIKHEKYFIGNGDIDQAFVTLSIQMIEGRSDELKARISKDALAVLVSFFPLSLAQLKTSITVQVIDIHKASYCRKASYSNMEKSNP